MTRAKAPTAVVAAAVAAATPSLTSYGSEGAGIADILDRAIADEPAPSPEVVRQVEAIHAAPAGGPIEPAPELTPADNRARAEKSAAATVGLLITGGRFIGAEEWEPENADEHRGLVMAFADVYEVRGSPPIPPELALLITVGRYAQKRFTKPKTRAKLGGLLASLPLPGFALRMLGVELDDDAAAPPPLPRPDLDRERLAA